MLLYFTSGTVRMPKMVNHDFVYPPGHILTAKYGQIEFTGQQTWTGAMRTDNYGLQTGLMM
jgi:hypothetical protein